MKRCRNAPRDIIMPHGHKSDSMSNIGMVIRAVILLALAAFFVLVGGQVSRQQQMLNLDFTESNYPGGDTK